MSRSFHAHVYYDPGTRHVAARLRQELGRLGVRTGRMHDVPVGPHSKAMFQVLIDRREFAEVIPWLMLNRAGLDVLVHPETGNELADHTAHACWLGSPLPLRLETLAAAESQARRQGPDQAPARVPSVSA